MERIVLLSCTKRKKNYPCPAAEMYSESSNFSKAYEYAKLIGDKIFILSAKYGLLTEDQIISPYNLTLNDQSVQYRKSWAEGVFSTLRQHSDPKEDHFTIITGKKYYEYLLPNLTHHAIPLEGKSLGLWNPSLTKLIMNQQTNVTAKEVHELFAKYPHYNYQTINQVPFENGIYIMFDTTETYLGNHRIVRIGTHTGQNNLISRLKNHYVSKNQRGSIFRKNIGRCLLNFDHDPYLTKWNLSRRTDECNVPFESELENRISDYINAHIQFTCFKVDTKKERLRLEEGMISALHADPNFTSPSNWLGNSSPIEDIRDSGLWNREGLHADSLSRNEFLSISFNDPVHNHTRAEAKKEPVASQRNAKNNTTQDFRDYIQIKLKSAFDSDKSHVDLVSGELHKQLQLKQRMPSICNAMYKLQLDSDEILTAPPKGKGATLKIRYYAKNH